MQSLVLTILLVVPYVVYRFERFHHSKKFNVFSKACFGVAFAILSVAILNLPLPTWYSWLIVIMIGGLVSNIVNSLRVFKMERVCKKCPMHDMFPKCDGFKSIVEKLERDGFLTFEKFVVEDQKT